MKQADTTFKEEVNQRMRKAPWWIISLIFHAGLVVMLGYITMTPDRIERGFYDSPIETEIEQAQEEPSLTELEKNIFEEEEVVVTEEIIESPSDIAEVTDTSEVDTQAAVASIEVVPVEVDPSLTDATLGFNASALSGDGQTGVGSGDGALGDIGGGVMTYYSTRCRSSISHVHPEALDTVQRSLAYLARIQESDGSWNPGKHEGKADSATSVAVSGLATLCFLGAGHSETAGKYRKEVRKALAWLRAQQQTTGLFSSNMYANGIANMAVAEGYGMAPNPLHRTSAQRGVDAIFTAMNPAGGWDYKAYAPGQPSNPKWQDSEGWRCDSSVAGWQLLAIKSAKMSGLKVSASNLNKALARVKQSTNGSTHLLGYTGPAGVNPRMAAVGLVVGRFFGTAKKRDKTAKSPADLLLNHLPNDIAGKGAKANGYYHVYYSSLAMFQQGGKWWLQWRDAMVSFLRGTQNVAGADLDGSWDPEWGAGQHGVVRLGRAGVTAAYCLSMEVFWRYRRMR